MVMLCLMSQQWNEKKGPRRAARTDDTIAPSKLDCDMPLALRLPIRPIHPPKTTQPERFNARALGHHECMTRAVGMKVQRVQNSNVQSAWSWVAIGKAFLATSLTVAVSAKSVPGLSLLACRREKGRSTCGYGTQHLDSVHLTK